MKKALAVAVWVSFLAMLAVGCNPIATAYFLFRGDSKNPAEHPLTPPEGSKDVSVVILVSAPNVGYEFAGADRDLSAAVGRRLVALTKDGKNPVKVVDGGKVDKFKSSTPDWKAMSASEVGKQLGADYVIDLALSGVSLYEPGSGKLIYQGQATVEGTVYAVATGQQHAHYYANPKLESKPAGDIPPGQYRTKLMDRVADEVVWKHVPHANDQQIANPVGR